MTAEKRDQKKPSWIVVTAIAGGVLALIVMRLTSPSAPPPAPEEEYTFQPEPRRPPINLQQSSGGLSSRSAMAPVPSLQSANCKTLQDFANYEYEKRFREGKVSDLMVFRGFEQQEVSITKNDILTCSGGSFLRRGKNGSLTCDNAILSYDSRSNTLTYNLLYAYVARGLQPQCSDDR